MTELTEKLREYAEVAVNLDELRPLMVMAADKIEQQRAVLVTAKDYVETVRQNYFPKSVTGENLLHDINTVLNLQ